MLPGCGALELRCRSALALPLSRAGLQGWCATSPQEGVRPGEQAIWALRRVSSNAEPPRLGDMVLLTVLPAVALRFFRGGAERWQGGGKPKTPSRESKRESSEPGTALHTAQQLVPHAVLLPLTAVPPGVPPCLGRRQLEKPGDQHHFFLLRSFTDSNHLAKCKNKFCKMAPGSVTICFQSSRSSSVYPVAKPQRTL
ncbi:hypothetical protein NDU88_000740 [Pleurodeles waltl]|uniref:Uncharacterized protein n=1 Tax=Pleurodeles waltl TaxID=8319 RepID=A0AAV7P6M4_PLEWA|nr:hypothetical protein NDU88_000740 [Pleurodeles waltl]